MSNARKVRYEKFTAYFFGEGGKEKRFFRMFENSEKFKQLLPNWVITPDNAHGESCETILNKCIASCTGNRSYDVVFCFIDLDKLTHDYGHEAEEQKARLEEKAERCSANIYIIWQDQDHEQELSRAAGKVINKARLKQQLNNRRNAIKIMNSGFAKQLIEIMNAFESEHQE